MNKVLKDVMERVETRPEEDQNELLGYALEIEARRANKFDPTLEELAAIDEAIAAVKRGEIATDAEVEAILATYRRL